MADDLTQTEFPESNADRMAIIGGTGMTQLQNLDIVRREVVMTPYGEPSSPLAFGCIKAVPEREVVFLARHGYAHNIPPHMVNYRANLWALKSVGVKKIIAVNAVGGIRDDIGPGVLVIPDQILDYTTNRVNTFFEINLTHVTHIDFTEPYSQNLRQLILDCAVQEQLDIIDGATYAATEGPRLETAAEIRKLKQDGCHIVGMTGMPEAALARELELDYASIAISANWAAGLSDEIISMAAIEAVLKQGMTRVRQLLSRIIAS